MRRPLIIIALILLLAGNTCLCAPDWTGFRGPGMRGHSQDTGLALTWSETENLQWKRTLPGPGSSSPIIIGNKILVTCYSGYGLDRDNPGDASQLKRHLVCINAENGTTLWDQSMPAVQPDLPYKGMLREHGYASSTPASDGKSVYVFFGKNGVYAFDLQGNKRWQTNVGSGSDEKKWGCAASVTLHKDLVLIDAWDESKTLYALSKEDGTVVWKRDLSATGLTFSTPTLAQLSNGRTELIMLLPTQIWGLNPDTGETRWFVKTSMKDTTIGTPIVIDDIAYIYGGGVKSLSSLALRLGGTGDVTDTHVIWSGKEAVSVPSPIYTDGLLYWVTSGGKACCQDAKTGELKYSQDLPNAGRFAVYASVVHADDRLYAVTRKGGTYVLPAKPQFEILAHNTFAFDTTDFNGSPMINKGRIVLRSNRYLYCIGSANLTD
jgi:outer membrane protein assembly factor BamB